MTADVARRNALVEEHLGLVDNLAGAVAARVPACFERDDLFQAGVLGLMTAAERWRPETGVPFAAYAHFRVRGAMLDICRGRNYKEAMFARTSERISDVNLPFDDIEAGADYAMYDPGFEPRLDEQIDTEREVRRVLAVVEKLTPTERAVVELHYLEERTLKSMHRNMGVCASRVSQIHQAAVAAVREELLAEAA